MRTLVSGEAAALASAHTAGCWFIEIGYADPLPVFRATTWDHSIPWDGHEWRGMGDIVSASAIKEASGLLVTSYKLTLPAVQTSQLAQLQAKIKGTPVRIWDVLLNPENLTVINAHLIDSARIDRAKFEIGGTTSVASIEVTSENADFRRRRVWRWTDADQRAKYPDDTGMRFVSQATQKTLVFPTKEAQF
ncbi:MAG: hypothetical protein ACEQSH_00705 [Bacteroidia bacterium]